MAATAVGLGYGPRMKLGRDPLPNLPPGWAIKAAIAFRQKVLDWANSLLPPEAALAEWATAMMKTQMLHLAAKWQIADLLDEHGAMTGAEIAARIGTNADATHRMLRACVSMGLFRFAEAKGDAVARFANNRMSQALLRRSDISAAHNALYWGSASNVAAWVDFENVVRTGKNAFGRLFGMSVWDWFDRQPEERETFGSMMSIATTQMAPAIAAAYPDFGRIGRLCDVGGGRGIMLSEILVRHPDMRGILFDGDGVLALAGDLLRARGVHQRVELVPGSFFTTPLPAGADAYLLKNILHDWDDARCLQILRNVRAACDSGTRLLVCDLILEPTDAGFGALADVHMMTVADEGRERSRDEFERLFTAAGFRLARVFDNPLAAVLEGIAK